MKTVNLNIPRTAAERIAQSTKSIEYNDLIQRADRWLEHLHFNRRNLAIYRRSDPDHDFEFLVSDLTNALEHVQKLLQMAEELRP